MVLDKNNNIGIATPMNEITPPINNLEKVQEKKYNLEDSFKAASRVDVSKINFSTQTLDKIDMNKEIIELNKKDPNNLDVNNPNAKSITSLDSKIEQIKNDKEINEYLKSESIDYSTLDKSRLVSEVGSFVSAQANVSPQAVQRLIGS